MVNKAREEEVHNEIFKELMEKEEELLKRHRQR
jgi:hypothetical protein